MLRPYGLEPLYHPDWKAKQIKVWVLRLDQIHPQIQGNKWFKLKYNLHTAQNLGLRRLLTFGGAYSNHLLATAAAAQLFDFEAIGIVRGEATHPLNPVLKQAQTLGMHLEFWERGRYRRKHEVEILAELNQRWGPCYIIPEGGANLEGIKGVAELSKQLPFFPLHTVACGTGNTLAGMVSGLPSNTRVIGFPVLKGDDFLKSEIQAFLMQIGLNAKQLASWELKADYHGGGYAKVPKPLKSFLQEFSRQTDLPLEPVYTGKHFWGLHDLIVRGYFPPGTRILAWHTGGLTKTTTPTMQTVKFQLW